MAVRALASIDAALAWLAERGVRALATDSRRVQPGDAFIAWPGYAVDGRQFVRAALAAGAVACLIEAEGAEAFDFEDSSAVASLPGLKASTGGIASGFMKSPSEALAVIAITGTNGKTSVAWWVAQALGALGRRSGLIGTLGVGEPPVAGRASAISFTGMTTPDPVTVQAGLRQFADAGFAVCAIEATSIGIAEQRLAGTRISVALFTNFTQDHLDFHGSMDAYWQAKAQLFSWPGLQAAVVNIDDAQGASLASSLMDKLPAVWTYSAGASSKASLVASHIRYDGGGLSFELAEGDERASVATALIGDYNVSNLLAAIGGMRALGVSLADAASACAALTPVPGRMQRVAKAADTSPSAGPPQAGLDPLGGALAVSRERGAPFLPEVIVDFAHTPDALEKALTALKPFAQERGGELWCVFGCGGNRDAGKRPLMGALAQRLADHTVITSDNPRHEAPAFILLQIVAGLAGSQERVKVIEDRRAAIAHAVRNADARDVILVAGKGHEDYQEIRGVKQHFSDVEEASAALAARASLHKGAAA